MKIFLKARSWQLFLLLFVVPVVIILLMPKMFFVSLIILLTTPIFIGWWWTLGTSFNMKVKPEVRMNARFFKMALIFAFVVGIFSEVFSIIKGQGNSIIVFFRWFVFLLWCYGDYFISKNIVMADKQEKVSFSDYARVFFLLWFYPIGVWFIQPRANKIYENERTQGSTFLDNLRRAVGRER